VSLPREAHPVGPAQASINTPILILGLAGLSMHHGALGVMRSAGSLGIPVFHTQRGRRSPIDRSRYSRGSLTLPRDASEDCALEILREFGAGHGPAILLAVDDTSAMFVADHGDMLKDVFLFPHQPSGLARALADKRSMHRLCVDHAIPTPLVAYPKSESEVCRHAAEAQFPVVAKRIDASLPVASSTPNVAVAQDRDELLAAYRSMESSRRPNVMLQEYIPDTPQANWMFNGYFTGDSECMVSFTGQKLRQSPPDAGATTLGVYKVNPSLEEATKRFMKTLGYRGILDADYRLDHRDGQYKLLDVNPRIGSSFRLFVAADGTDVLRALYLDLTGQEVLAGQEVAATQRDGRRWLVEPQDLRSSLIQIKRNELTVGKWLGSLRHIEETAWWAREDPRPFVAMVTSLLAARLRRRLHGVRRALKWPRGLSERSGTPEP
jgi:D-aspartate ligase